METRDTGMLYFKEKHEEKVREMIKLMQNMCMNCIYMEGERQKERESERQLKLLGLLNE